jgi:hypothetical protein
MKRVPRNFASLCDQCRAFAARLTDPNWPTPAEHDKAEQTLIESSADAQAQLPLQGDLQDA